jgi:hypothetical protein
MYRVHEGWLEINPYFSMPLAYGEIRKIFRGLVESFLVKGSLSRYPNLL